MEELQFENSDVSIMTTIIEKYPNRIISMLSDPYSEETNDLVKIVSNETGVNDELLPSLFNDLTQAAMIGGIVKKDDGKGIVVQTCGPLKKIGSGTVHYYGQVRSVTLYESGEEELFITDSHGKEEDIKGCDSLSCEFSYDDGTGYSGRIRITDVRLISDDSIDHSFGCVYRYHGKGRLTWANKDVYEGDFIDDGRTGRGS